MSSRIEVLAPAGSMDILKVAISAGADAVYVGGARFGARAFADNFDEETLVEAVHYAHIHGRKLYLTVNTLFLQRELDELYNFLKAPYEAGLDAVIVQDIGVASYIKRQFPGLALHVSTQMTVTQESGGMLLKELGASRIVPARELSLFELRRLKKSTGLELEVFVHGALCYCYSGQCLLSSVIGGRSGNRGRCAQPCRLPYIRQDFASSKKEKHSTGKSYLLSPKDLCALDVLPQLISCGVDSLKIEGRMKNSYYVAATVSAYRQAVDAIADDTYDDALIHRLKRNMAEIYNRGGFTKGYFHQHNGREMMSMDRPNHQGIYVGKIEKILKGSIVFTAKEALSKGDVISVIWQQGEEISLTVPTDYAEGRQVTLRAGKTGQMHQGMSLYRTKNAGLMAYLEKKYISEPKKEKVKIQVIIRKDLYATMSIALGDNSVTVQGGMVTKAGNRPLTREDILDKVSRLGNTPFIAEDICIEYDEDAFLPVKELNELRRTGLHALTRQLIEKNARMPVDRVSIAYMDRDNGKNQEEGLRVRREGQGGAPMLSVQVENRRVLDVVLKQKEVSRVYLECAAMSDEEVYECVSRIKAAGKELIICMPHIFRYDAMESFEAFLAGVEVYDGLLVRNIDSFAYVKNRKEFAHKLVIGDSSLYAYNHNALAYYENRMMGMQFVMPRELSGEMLKTLWCDSGNRLIFDIYGNTPVMVSAQCMQKNTGECNHQSGKLHIRDKKDVDYTVQCVCRYCYNLIYNGITYSLLGLSEEVLVFAPCEVRMLFRDEDSDFVAEMLHRAFCEYLHGENTASKVKELFTRYGIQTTKGHFRRGIE